MQSRLTQNAEFTARRNLMRSVASVMLTALGLLCLLAIIGALLLFAASAPAMAQSGEVPRSMSLWFQILILAVALISVAGLVALLQIKPDNPQGTLKKPIFADDEPDPGYAKTGATDPDSQASMFPTLPNPTRPPPPMPMVKPYRPLDEMEGLMPTESYLDNLAVDRFGPALKAKLQICRENGREGWWNADLCSIEELNGQLRLAMRKGDLLDIACYCMFLHQRGQSSLSK